MTYIDNYGRLHTNELYHHGILGQRWGKRNGPPYPLGVSDHSASEKKAGWKNSLESSNKSDHQSFIKAHSKAIKIGLAVAGTTLLAVGAYHLYSTGALNGLGSKLPLSSNRSSIGAGMNTPENIERLKTINPNYSKGIEYQMNCGNCAIANELSMRGIQASAGPNPMGMSMSQLTSYFKGLSSESFCEPDMTVIPRFPDLPSRFTQDAIRQYNNAIMSRAKQVNNLLTKELANQFPEGSRGAIFVPSHLGSHWMSWKVGPGGKVLFENSQDVSLDIVGECFSKFSVIPKCSAANLTAIRLDNVDIDMDALGDVVNLPGADATQFNTMIIKGKNFVTRLF